MKRAVSLATLAAIILLAGGCKQPETTVQPAPVISQQKEQTAKEEPHAAVAEKSIPPVATPTTAPPAPAPATGVRPPPVLRIKVAPVKTTTTAPVAAVKPATAIAPASAVKTVTYKASNGTVTFAHLRHAANHPCSRCHPSEPPTRIVLDKDKAHQLCKGCHQQQGSGPTQCSGCHKKE